MKKIYLFLSIFLLAYNVNAQFIVYEVDEGTTPYTDYQVFETHSTDLTLPSTTFDFRIKNTGSSPIKVQIKVESLINTNGDAELCVNGLCASPVFQGDIFPLNADYLEIQPGELQPDANATKFGNYGQGIDPSQPADYVLKFYQINDNGNEIGTPLHIICRYTNDSSGINDIKQTDLPFVYPNPANDVIAISHSSTKISNIKIFDITGKQVKSLNLQDGKQTIDISDLQQGLYLISLFDKKNIVSQQKLIVK